METDDTGLSGLPIIENDSKSKASRHIALPTESIRSNNQMSLFTSESTGDQVNQDYVKTEPLRGIATTTASRTSGPDTLDSKQLHLILQRSGSGSDIPVLSSAERGLPTQVRSGDLDVSNLSLTQLEEQERSSGLDVPRSSSDRLEDTRHGSSSGLGVPESSLTHFELNPQKSSDLDAPQPGSTQLDLNPHESSSIPDEPALGSTKPELSTRQLKYKRNRAVRKARKAAAAQNNPLHNTKDQVQSIRDENLHSNVADQTTQSIEDQSASDLHSQAQSSSSIPDEPTLGSTKPELSARHLYHKRKRAAGKAKIAAAKAKRTAATQDNPPHDTEDQVQLIRDENLHSNVANQTTQSIKDQSASDLHSQVQSSSSISDEPTLDSTNPELSGKQLFHQRKRAAKIARRAAARQNKSSYNTEDQVQPIRDGNLHSNVADQTTQSIEDQSAPDLHNQAQSIGDPDLRRHDQPIGETIGGQVQSAVENPLPHNITSQNLATRELRLYSDTSRENQAPSDSKPTSSNTVHDLAVDNDQRLSFDSIGSDPAINEGQRIPIDNVSNLAASHVLQQSSHMVVRDIGIGDDQKLQSITNIQDTPVTSNQQPSSVIIVQDSTVSDDQQLSPSKAVQEVVVDDSNLYSNIAIRDFAFSDDQVFSFIVTQDSSLDATLLPPQGTANDQAIGADQISLSIDVQDLAVGEDQLPLTISVQNLASGDEELSFSIANQDPPTSDDLLPPTENQIRSVGDVHMSHYVAAQDTGSTHNQLLHNMDDQTAPRDQSSKTFEQLALSVVRLPLVDNQFPITIDNQLLHPGDQPLGISEHSPLSDESTQTLDVHDLQLSLAEVRSPFTEDQLSTESNTMLPHQAPLENINQHSSTSNQRQSSSNIEDQPSEKAGEEQPSHPHQQISRDSGNTSVTSDDDQSSTSSDDQPTSHTIASEPVSGVMGLKWAYATHTSVDRILLDRGIWLFEKPQTYFHLQPYTYTRQELGLEQAPIVVDTDDHQHREPSMEFDKHVLYLSTHTHPWSDVRSKLSHADMVPAPQLVEYQACEAAGLNVWRHDRELLDCRLPGCKVKVSDHDPSTTICLGCGPKTIIRYCSPEHSLADLREHWKECGHRDLLIKRVVDGTTAPGKFDALCPAIRSIGAHMSYAIFRQATYAARSKGHYSLFDPVTEEPFTLFWGSDDPRCWEMELRVERLLNLAFLDRTNLIMVGLLYRMLRECLIQKNQWVIGPATVLKLQFREEFDLDVSRVPESRLCECEWVGSGLPEGAHVPECGRLYRSYSPPYQTSGLRGFVEMMEGRYWVLRAWRQQHPAVPHWYDRVQGDGYGGAEVDGVEPRLGPGWDGWGAYGDDVVE